MHARAQISQRPVRISRVRLLSRDLRPSSKSTTVVAVCSCCARPPELCFKQTLPGGRDAFGEVLRSRSREHLFVEVVLIRGVNDGPGLARALASLLRPLPTRASINLLPYNDTGHPLFRAATPEAVKDFQRILNEEGFVATIRTARCDRNTPWQPGCVEVFREAAES